MPPVNEELGPEEAEAEAKLEQDKKRAMRREREAADFRKVMSEPYGRRFVRRLIAESRLYWTGLGLSAEELHERAGLREQGIRLMAEVAEVCPEFLANMYSSEKDKET